MRVERWAAAILVLTMAALVASCDGPHRIISHGPMRIVALVPSVTETLFALGAGPEVVGVSQYSDFPPQARKLPQVGTFITPNIEQIAALRPTLVIGLASSSDLREIRALEAMGIATLMVDEDSVEVIERSIERVGDRIGRPRQARELVAQIRAAINHIQKQLAGIAPRRVLMVVGHQPMVAVGPGTYLDDLLKLAHARNIADGSAQAWPRLSIEYIIASRPQVILDGQMGTDPHSPATFWEKFASLPAVRDGRVVGYPDDPTLHPGPRVAQTLELLARRIHPEAFAGRRKPMAQARAI